MSSCRSRSKNRQPCTDTRAAACSATADDSVTTSIFVRDFPEGVTPEKLEAAFSRFGPIRGGVQGINLRQQKGKEDFAFVEFEELAAMQASIEGQVIIDGKTVRCLLMAPLVDKSTRSLQQGSCGVCGLVYSEVVEEESV